MAVRQPRISHLQASPECCSPLVGTITWHYATLCFQFAYYRKIRAAVRKEVARAEVKVLAYELHARGIKITRDHIRPFLTSSDYINLPEGRAALEEVRRELGLCTFRFSNGS